MIDHDRFRPQIARIASEIGLCQIDGDRVLFEFRGATHALPAPVVGDVDAAWISERIGVLLSFYHPGQEPLDCCAGEGVGARWYAEPREDNCTQIILHPSVNHGYCSSIHAANDGSHLWCYVDYGQGGCWECHADPRKGLLNAMGTVRKKVESLFERYGKNDPCRQYPEEK